MQLLSASVRPSTSARQLAEKEGVEIKLYSIIYEAIDEIKAAMEGMLEPTKVEKLLLRLRFVKYSRFLKLERLQVVLL